jgi:hypothetical protein
VPTLKLSSIFLAFITLTCIFQFDTFLNKLGALGYQFAHKRINSKKKRSSMTKKKRKKTITKQSGNMHVENNN